jgi:hypothetical protein
VCVPNMFSIRIFTANDLAVSKGCWDKIFDITLPTDLFVQNGPSRRVITRFLCGVAFQRLK